MTHNRLLYYKKGFSRLFRTFSKQIKPGWWQYPVLLYYSTINSLPKAIFEQLRLHWAIQIRSLDTILCEHVLISFNFRDRRADPLPPHILSDNARNRIPQSCLIQCYGLFNTHLALFLSLTFLEYIMIRKNAEVPSRSEGAWIAFILVNASTSWLWPRRFAHIRCVQSTAPGSITGGNEPVGQKLFIF